MTRLLMYSQDGWGLGHLRRSSNIAAEVLRRDPTGEVLILADSPAAWLAGAGPGMDFIKLPTLVKIGRESWKESAWESALLSGNVGGTVRLRAQLIHDAFHEFNPDSVLVDHMPVGALGELMPLLDSAVRRKRPPRLYLGLRDILESPGTIRRAWTELGAYEYLSAFDKVLIYGVRELHDSTSAYALVPNAREVVYCNYVTRCEPAASTSSVRSEPYVLLTGGGGHDAFPLARAFLQSIGILSRDLEINAVVVAGPTMSPAHRDELKAYAAPSVEIRSCVDDAESWIRDASAVVTLGGYNSLCEVLARRKKALVIPRSGPSAEQTTRARLFAQRGLIHTLDATDLSAPRLAESLVALLLDDGIPNLDNMPALDGAENTARLLLEDAKHRKATVLASSAEKKLASASFGPALEGTLRAVGEVSL
jgi:predicted glycosyltransferase